MPTPGLQQPLSIFIKTHRHHPWSMWAFASIASISTISFGKPGSVMVIHSNCVHWNELHESNKCSAHRHQALQQQLVAVYKVWKSSNVLNTVPTVWMLPLCNAIRHVPAEHWMHCATD